jgi:hypothetical protein
LPTRVLLFLFHGILSLFPPSLLAARHFRFIHLSHLVGTFRIDSSRARFASSSACSFPVIPACPGTQHSVIFSFHLSMSYLIFLVFELFVWLFTDADIMVLNESVNITLLTLVDGSFCIAPIMASCSTLNMDDWSLILFRVIFFPSLYFSFTSSWNSAQNISFGVPFLILQRDQSILFPSSVYTAWRSFREFSPLFFHQCPFAREVLRLV